MIGIATCRLRIATCGIQVLGLESQPRSESQPAGCRLLGLESQLAGCEVSREPAECRLRIEFESQPVGCRFWDWNRNLQVANWIATCGMQVLGLESQLRLESQPVGCRLYRRDCNRNLQVANWIATLRSAGCELNCDLRDAGFGTGITTSKWIATCRLQAFGTGIATCRLRIKSQPAGCRFWDWNRNLQVANWIATLRSAGCELNRNLRDAGFGTGITTSTWIATCGLQAYRRDRKWSKSQLAGCELNRNLRVVGFGTWIAYWGEQVIRHILTWSLDRYILHPPYHFHY